MFKNTLSANCIVPPVGVGADYYAPNWVGYYYYPFDIGITFPYSTLVTDFLRTIDASPSQIMPGAWRVLACLDEIEKKHNLGINMAVVCHTYLAKKFHGGMFGLVVRTNREPLVVNLEWVHDRGWKHDFLFVEKLSLGEEGSYLRERWNDGDCSIDSAMDDEVAEGVVQRIKALPLADKIWPNCLNRPIRNSAQVDVEAYLAKSPKSAAHKNTIGSESQSRITRGALSAKKKGKSIVCTTVDLTHEDFSLDSTDNFPDASALFDSGRQFAKEYKSPILPALERSSGKELFMKRGRESGSDSSRRQSITPSPFSKKMKATKLPSPPRLIIADQPLQAPKYWQWPYLHGYSVNSVPGELQPMLNSLLLPETVNGHNSKPVEGVMSDTIGHAFHALQAALLSRNNYMDIATEFAELKLEHAACESRMKKLEDKVAKSVKEASGAKKDLVKFVAKVEKSNAELFFDAERKVTQGIMRSRVDTMLEFRSGEWSLADVEEAVKIYNATFPDDAIEPGEDEDAGPSKGDLASDKGDDDRDDSAEF